MLDLQGNPVRWQTTSHAYAQIAHACKRATERYGFEFTPDDYERLRQRIVGQFKDQAGIVFLSKDTTSSRFAVWHGGEWLPVVYNRKLRTIVTFLPKRILRAHKKKLPW